MTDKVQKIRDEVERLRSLHQMKYQQLDADSSMSLVECGKRNLCNELLSFIDSLQEEPVKIKKGCKYRCICNVTNNDTGNISFVAGKIYLAPEDNTLVSEENGWLCDTSEDASNFELVEEPVSEDLGEYINKLSKQFPEVSFAKLSRIVVRVAKWQKVHLWKPADGDDLPEIDREVVVLLNNGRVAFGHRPPEYWDGKDIITGKVTRNYVERYDKGMWNIPNVKYWLDCELPKIEED